MEYIREWLNNISMYLIFVILLNILISNKAYKSYINLIVGFIFILILLNPIKMIFKHNFENISLNAIKYERILNNSYKETEKVDTDTNNKRSILMIYKKNIEEQVKNLVAKNISVVNILRLELNIGESDEDMGEIKRIELYASIKPEASVKDMDTKELANKLKKLLKDFYNINEDNIDVII